MSVARDATLLSNQCLVDDDQNILSCATGCASPAIVLPGESADSRVDRDIPLDEALLFTVVGQGDCPAINVYESCKNGTCTCVHFINNIPTQLKPCRFAFFLDRDNVFDPSVCPGSKFIWEGVLQGFKIVDQNCPTSYVCKNYDSILGNKFHEEMTQMVREELGEGKVSFSPTQPVCVNALGGIEKSNGSLRPITDCSMPRKLAINNYMETTYNPFSYKSVVFWVVWDFVTWGVP